MHYERMRRHGNLDGKFPQGDPLARLLSRVEIPGGIFGCWLVTSGSFKNNYSTVGEGKYGWHYGHRLTYQRYRGPIPAGIRLHHECETPACVNPFHLTPTTARSHALEHGLGVGPCPSCGCEDWYIRPDNGSRQCRECPRRRRAVARSRKLGLR